MERDDEIRDLAARMAHEVVRMKAVIGRMQALERERQITEEALGLTKARLLDLTEGYIPRREVRVLRVAALGQMVLIEGRKSSTDAPREVFVVPYEEATELIDRPLPVPATDEDLPKRAVALQRVLT